MAKDLKIKWQKIFKKMAKDLKKNGKRFLKMAKDFLKKWQKI